MGEEIEKIAEAFEGLSGNVDMKDIDAVSRIIAEQSGSDPEKVKVILLDLMKKDSDINNIISEIAKVKQAAAGEASEKAVDILVARLLAKLSKRIERKIDESDSIDDLIKLLTIKTLLDSMNNSHMKMVMELVQSKAKIEREMVERIYQIKMEVLEKENKMLKQELKELKELVKSLMAELSKIKEGNSEDGEEKGKGPIGELIEGIADPVVKAVMDKFYEKLEQSGVIDEIADDLVRVTAESAKGAVADIKKMQ